MIPWILIGGAIVAGGLLLNDNSNVKVKTKETWREIPESEVPLDIRQKAEALKSQYYAEQLGVNAISESQVPVKIRNKLKK